MELVAFHDTLTQLFDRHMEALLLLDLERARDLLHRFQREMTAHVIAEEEVILPLYGARTETVPGGTVEIFTAEHRKMLAMIGEFLAAVERLEPEPRGVLELLDREFSFKHLMAHHDNREVNLLYRWMDRITSPSERHALLHRLDELDGRVARPL
jgi:hypothetical protein